MDKDNNYKEIFQEVYNDCVKNRIIADEMKNLGIVLHEKLFDQSNATISCDEFDEYQNYCIKRLSKIVRNESHIENVDINKEHIETLIQIVLEEPSSFLEKVRFEDDEREILGYVAMFSDSMTFSEESEKSFFLTSVLNKDLFKFSEGEGGFRNTNNFITDCNLETINFDLICNFVIEQDEKLQKVLNNIDNLKASEYVEEVVKLSYENLIAHKFVDGNGRTERCFLNFLFSEKNLPSVFVNNKDKYEEYIPALQEANEGDFESLNEYYFKSLTKAMLEIKDLEKEDMEIKVV